MPPDGYGTTEESASLGTRAVPHPDHPPCTFSSSQRRVHDTDVSKLKRAFVNEKCAPEILPFEFDLVQRVVAAVDSRESVVASARASASTGPSSAADDLQTHVFQSELNRVRFLLRAYYRYVPRVSQIQLLHTSTRRLFAHTVHPYSRLKTDTFLLQSQHAVV